MDQRNPAIKVALTGVTAVAALATAFGASAAVLEPTTSQARVHTAAPAAQPPSTARMAATAAEHQRTAAVRATQKRLRAKAATSAHSAHVARQRASRSAQRAVAVHHPRRVARQIAAGRYGWHNRQFDCLSSLWQKESRWNHRARNRSSGAYGIPQALPGSKMATKGADWRRNPVTQITWGLSYVKGRYGSPCRAWAHSRATGWY
jgi:Transglycosylase SLT domain